MMVSNFIVHLLLKTSLKLTCFVILLVRGTPDKKHIQIYIFLISVHKMVEKLNLLCVSRPLKYQGPVVQSIVSLMSLLSAISLTV